MQSTSASKTKKETEISNFKLEKLCESFTQKKKVNRIKRTKKKTKKKQKREKEKLQVFSQKEIEYTLILTEETSKFNHIASRTRI